MSSSTPPVDPHASLPPTVVILGNDAQLAARPATPVQLAHACLAAGFRAAIPASWGDELVAAATLKAIESRATRPAIQCACPHVARRLLAAGTELAANLISLVAPPVAVARYLRSHSPQGVRVTYVGRCPSASDDSIDARLTPEEFLAQLADRGIRLLDQPEVFESVIPPDRRRHHSLPGGLPAADELWTKTGLRLETLQTEDFAADLAERVSTRADVLIDAALVAGCVCSGAVLGATPDAARSAVIALEPPRAASAVMDERAVPALDLALPIVARAESGVAPEMPARSATRDIDVTSTLGAATPPPLGSGGAEGHARRPRLTPPGSPIVIPSGVESAAAPPAAPRRRSPTGTLRVVPPGSVPLASDHEGRILPRAYVARRRSPRGGVPVIPDSAAAAAPAETLASPAAPGIRSITTPGEADSTRTGDVGGGDAERRIEHSVEPAVPASPAPATPAPTAHSASTVLVQEPPARTPPPYAPGAIERSLTFFSANPRVSLAVALAAAGLVLGIAIGYAVAHRAATSPAELGVGHGGELQVDSSAASAAPGLGTRRGTDRVAPSSTAARVAAAPGAAAVSRRSRRVALPSAEVATGGRQRAAATTVPAPAAPAQPSAAPIGVDSAALRARRDSAVASARAESLAAEREAIRREIERRRVRIDSLVRAQGGAPPAP